MKRDTWLAVLLSVNAALNAAATSSYLAELATPRAVAAVGLASATFSAGLAALTLATRGAVERRAVADYKAKQGIDWDE